MVSSKIIFIAGPTAVGKTETAAAAARDVGGEVVSCDAMQVYREVTIASNKPSRATLTSVPHHLIGFLSVQDDFDVATFNRMATDAIRQIIHAGRIPVVTGGSGMYMQVLLDGIFEQAGRDTELRDQLHKRAVQEGGVALYAELKTVDPESAVRIHPHDTRRIIRALEVSRVLGEPMSLAQKRREGLWGHYDIKMFCLNRKRSALYDRIDRRVEQMFGEGLIEEVRALADRPLSRTAGAIIGIPEIRGYLNGEYDLEDAREQMKRNTRRLAKRQLTWFRKEKRLTWLDVDEDTQTERIVKMILEQCGLSGKV